MKHGIVGNFPDSKILVIAGPTAVGKTHYATCAAQALDGEIVSADSMQIYKYMDIGSAKPSPEELATARHHLVDQIDPRDTFSVAEYQKLAKKSIAEILTRGKLPIVSGGTGLYINSLLYDMDFSVMPGREGQRQEWYREAELYGRDKLHQRLAELDPEAAARIHPNNLKKVIRAIEVAETTGQGIPDFSQSFRETQEYGFLLIGLTRNREELYDRIDKRVDLLMQAGLKEEVEGLLAKGLTEDNISMNGIGYKELIAYLHGEYDLEEAVRLIKRNTRHYAKRQITWLKRDPHIRWFNLSEFPTEEEALSEILYYVKEGLSNG